jgi:bifunctional non-homologous end joining protein LigD
MGVSRVPSRPHTIADSISRQKRTQCVSAIVITTALKTSKVQNRIGPHRSESGWSDSSSSIGVASRYILAARAGTQQRRFDSRTQSSYLGAMVLLRDRVALRGVGAIEPCLPTPAKAPPSGPGWIHEIKHDGFRLIARRDAAGVRLITRKGNDFTKRFPLIAMAVTGLPVRSCLIDGEAIVCDDSGLAVFELLRRYRTSATAVHCAFDLLELDGEDLRRQPIEVRKAMLVDLLHGVFSTIVVNEHFEGDGAIIYRHACKLGCEGIVSKRLGTPYKSGRSAHWVKVKNPAAPAVKREAEEDWSR